MSDCFPHDPNDVIEDYKITANLCNIIHQNFTTPLKKCALGIYVKGPVGINVIAPTGMFRSEMIACQY